VAVVVELGLAPETQMAMPVAAEAALVVQTALL